MYRECYISVDIESTGSVPGIYSMYELGASLLNDPITSFQVELALLNDNYEPGALAIRSVLGRPLTIADLHNRPQAQEPALAMQRFETWIHSVSKDQTPVFCGFNAPFDWMFVQYYFAAFLHHQFTGVELTHFPFGKSALDLKSYAMCLLKTNWRDCSKKNLPDHLLPKNRHTHFALDDAREQAELGSNLLTLNECAELLRP